MKKENIIILQKNEERSNRQYLIMIKGINNPTPFVVCSNLKEKSNNSNEYEWDWGHYHKDLLSALYTYYEYEIKEILQYDFDRIQKFINYQENYNDTDKIELTEREYKSLQNIIKFINTKLCKFNEYEEEE